MAVLRTAAVLLALLAPGCGGTGSLSGLVSYQGKPLVSGRVTAVAGEEGPRVGLIQPDGRYRIDGLPVGPVKLAVESPDPLAAPSGDGDGGKVKGRPPGWVALPVKYGDIKTSGLTVDVRAGSGTRDLALD